MYYIFLLIIICLIFLAINYTIKNNKNNKKEKLFYTTKDYPEFKLLEENADILIKEIPEFNKDKINFKRNREDWNNNGMDDLFEKLKNNDNWIESWNINNKDNIWFNFPLMYNNKPVGLAEKICPESIKLLKKLKNIKISGYSLLVPNSKLDEHTDLTGPTYNSMALNLNLVGNNCSLFIKSDKDNKYYEKKHKIGKAIIFNSEQLHYAVNNDPSNRIILYIDFTTD
jgi:beta-hydroxylase